MATVGFKVRVVMTVLTAAVWAAILACSQTFAIELETLGVFAVALLAFFHVYDVGQRIMLSIIGCISIFFFNVIRIVVICAIIYKFGSDSYYIAHTIIGRLVFYIMSILLYY